MHVYEHPNIPKVKCALAMHNTGAPLVTLTPCSSIVYMHTFTRVSVCVCRAPSLVVVLHFRTGLAAQSAHTSSTLLTAWISPITDIHVRGACQQQSVCFCWRARFRSQPALSGCRHERQKRRENSRACTAMHFPTATNAYTVHQKFSSI